MNAPEDVAVAVAAWTTGHDADGVRYSELPMQIRPDGAAQVGSIAEPDDLAPGTPVWTGQREYWLGDGDLSSVYVLRAAYLRRSPDGFEPVLLEFYGSEQVDLGDIEVEDVADHDAHPATQDLDESLRRLEALATGTPYGDLAEYHAG